jgi:hypothetical protein
LFEAIQCCVNGSGRDLPVQSGLNAAKDGASIGFFRQPPNSQQNGLLESTE